MKQGYILYESIPVVRIGVRKDDEGIVVARDYSCFSQMIEEYISYGTTKILIPKSISESNVVENMPTLSKKQIEILDDSNEVEIVNRLLHGVRKELNIKIDDRNNFLIFPKGMASTNQMEISTLHSDIKKLSLGFNHKIQIDLNIQSSIANLSQTRKQINNSETRILLAQLEGLLNQYKQQNIEGLGIANSNTPSKLLTLFDHLINDEDYIEYSDYIKQVRDKPNDKELRLKLRQIMRYLFEKHFIAEGWNYFTKFLTAWTGYPIPNSKAIASFVTNKELPVIINMEEARKKAISNWNSLNTDSLPIGRDGNAIDNNNIKWLPRMGGITTSGSKELFSFGTVGQLRLALEKCDAMLKQKE